MAETGVEIAINDGPATGGSYNYSYTNGTISVSVSSLGVLDGQTILLIDSTGTIGEINRQVRLSTDSKLQRTKPDLYRVLR